MAKLQPSKFGIVDARADSLACDLFIALDVDAKKRRKGLSYGEGIRACVTLLTMLNEYVGASYISLVLKGLRERCFYAEDLYVFDELKFALERAGIKHV